MLDEFISLYELIAFSGSRWNHWEQWGHQGAGSPEICSLVPKKWRTNVPNGFPYVRLAPEANQREEDQFFFGHFLM